MLTESLLEQLLTIVKDKSTSPTALHLAFKFLYFITKAIFINLLICYEKLFISISSSILRKVNCFVVHSL